jgi:hypothetical protein
MKEGWIRESDMEEKEGRKRKKEEYERGRDKREGNGREKGYARGSI